MLSALCVSGGGVAMEVWTDEFKAMAYSFGPH